MMAEDKKPQEELEFITVEAETGATSSPAEKITEVKTARSPKASDKEALLASMRKVVTGAKHPVAAFFHLLFKGLALALYLFGSIFIDNFVFIFVVCILLLAFDFWTVKNVTGRLLVGLRWWNRINDDGTSECKKDAKQKMQSLMSQGALGAFSSSAGSSIMSTIGGLALGGIGSAGGGPSKPTKSEVVV
ncbi:hypothetical protein BBJ29_000776 [Phytophthora kernoviae]|uniref:Golgi apparatus membrane protein TVP23 homolog n=1 Tax=Phytophthora kernoviae TaxID=325452 RepID=A0A3F2S157_9STRA|nr:hypothetical protein BBJ29_000776 [Phytophthora kernoviae]RLN68322.1 hypothetical protein BBP00_00001072 [Phytophthora kernoviae]